MLEIKMLFHNVGPFLRGARKIGFKRTLAEILDYLDIGVHYSRIECPVMAYPLKVSGNTAYWEKFERGEWEIDCITYISNVLRGGQVILDIGAWIGPYTLLFAKSVKDGGSVYAFEPDSWARRILSRNVKLNGLTNVKIYDFAITNFIGRSKLQAYGQWGDSMANLEGRKLKGTSRYIRVKTTTVDEFCRERLIRPDGMKIDVEGAEAQVVAGSQNVIRECHPWILVEFHGQFMTEGDRRRNWSIITGSARKVTYLQGSSTRYSYGSEVTSMPDCPYFHVFVEY